MPTPIAATPIKEPNLLVVEGKDEVAFFEALINYLKLQRIQIIDMEGKTKLRDRLGAIVSETGFADAASLVVVRDANANPEGAFQSVQDALKALKLPVPACPFLFTEEKPMISVIILPSGNAPGMLEDLCLKAVLEEPAMSCVNQYFCCLTQQNVTLPREISKAKVQVFLTSKPEVGLPLGIAAMKGFWPLDHKAFEEVRNLLMKIGI